jgi:uncharacterized protein YaiL (DUF2058 family)
MIEDDRLNPGSTASETQIAALERKIDDLKSKYILFFSGELKLPPEKEREETEKAIRSLIYGGAKTAKMSMIIQNLAARFSLYNNLWLKQLNEMESGVSKLQKKKAAPPQAKPQPQPKAERIYREVQLSLNDENSFEKLFAAYEQLLPRNSKTAADKESIINTMKTKMLTNNLVEAKVGVALQNGKLSITLKK